MREHLVLCATYVGSMDFVPLAPRSIASFLRRQLPEEAASVTVLDLTPSQSIDDAVRALAALRPTVVGLSCYVWSAERMYALCAAVKEEMPEVLTVLGGPEMSLDDEELAALRRRLPEADVIVQGEGELALLDILRAPPGHRPPPGSVIQGRDLPSLDLLGAPVLAESSPGHNRRLVAIEFGRGCRHHCAYCAMNHGARRNRSARDLALEFAWVKRHAPEVCLHVDSYINPSPAVTMERVRVIEEAGIAQSVTHFLCIDYLTVTEEEVRAVSRIRSLVSIGLQTTNRPALRAAFRGFRRDRFERVAEWIHRYGLNALVDIIYGLPADTLEGFYGTVDYVRALGLPYRGLRFEVVPGTGFYARRRELDLVWDPSSRKILSTPTMSREEIEEAESFSRRLDGLYEEGVLSHAMAVAGVEAGRRWIDDSLATPFVIEHLTERAPLYDYTMRPYAPRTEPTGALASVNLLYALLRDSGQRGAWRTLIERLRERLGPHRTVWGAKLAGGRLSFELYFYLHTLSANPGGHAEDPALIPAPISVADVEAALEGSLSWSAALPAHLPLVMFSVDVDDEVLASGEVDVLHLYLNSGLSYDLSAAGLEHANFYRFFELTSEHAVAEMTAHAAGGLLHTSAPGVGLQHVLLPELYACRTVCLAAKRHCDGVYFAGVDTGQLLGFLREHGWPQHVRDFVERHEEGFAPLRWDVGLDFVARPGGEGPIRWLKRGLYGIF